SPVPRFKSHVVIPARRGFIVDRNRTVIAQNRPEATLVADLNHLNTESILHRAVAHFYASQEAGWRNLNEAEKNVLLGKARKWVKKNLSKEEVIEKHLDYACEIIGRELQMESEAVRGKFKDGVTRIEIQKRIREGVARRIENELQERRIQGFSFERYQRRVYPMPTLASHLIGIRGYNKDDELVGLSGLEKSMDGILSGRDGRRVLKRDENGLVNLTESAEMLPARMGKHVKVTFDMGIQAIVEEELGMAFEAFNAKHGSIIVVDPHTGDILAMASRPDFNLNLRESYADAVNYAVSAQYESGSVMKIVPMAAALDMRRATRETVVDCGWGGIDRYGFRIRDHHRYGELTFDGVLVKSSNTGVFQFADMVGRGPYYQYLRDFGFGRPTGFPIPGEASGVIQNETNMRNFASAAYGYGVSVTPLQLAMAYSVLANGGKLMKPRLVDSIIADNGAVLDQTSVHQVREVVSPRTAKEMCLALEQVVLKGTGRRARVPGYRAGGKTGTAEKWDSKNRCYNEYKKILTFAGILPVHDPRFVCIVTIDEPSGLGEDFQIGGGTIAAPVFAQVAGRVARYMNLAPTEEIPEEDSSIALNPTE
ncbi:penicillin-binding protein 2, partial [Akkermansiaceae bacterium]|nr:penicillin-binding protein 2 [Akkermansiaceae bacterium]